MVKERFRGGKIIGLIIIGFIVLIILMGLIYWILTAEIKSDSMEEKLIIAFIGFAGSIIGGAITLIGVKMTLIGQDRRDFVNSFSQKYTSGMSILSKFSDAIRNLTVCMYTANHQPIGEHLHHFLRDKDEILIKAGEISIDAHEAARHIMGQAENWYKFITGNDQYGRKDDDPTERTQKYDFYLREMLKHLDKFKVEFVILEEKYNKFK